MIQAQTMALTAVDAYETYQDCTFTLPTVPSKVSDGTFIRCHFTGSLDHSEWLDCQFTDCDFANRSWTDSVLYRCTFTACHLLGTNFLGNTWKQTRVTGCRADYLNLSGSQLTACTLTDTSLREAYFRDVRIVQGLVCDQCDLEQASFWESNLAGVDLATSTFEQLEVPTDVVHLKGLTVRAYQAASVLSLFGVKIK